MEALLDANAVLRYLLDEVTCRRKNVAAAALGLYSGGSFDFVDCVLAAERVRGPAAHVAHRRRKQPIGTQQLVAIVTWLFFYSEMRTAREATRANGFMRRETFDLTDKADVFTSTSVTRRRIERTDK